MRLRPVQKRWFRGGGWQALVAAVLVLTTIIACKSSDPAAADAPPVPGAVREAEYINANLIRVGISDHAMTSLEYPSTRISATGPYEIRDLDSGRTIWQGGAGQAATITVNKTAFTLRTPAGTLQAAGPLEIRPAEEQHRLRILDITRRGEVPEYRGVFEIHRGFSSPAKLSVVNVVGLEDYLKAVVPNELPMRYGREAVKAQSIAARNYAIRPREKPWPNFDICDSQYCQVYLGAQTETPGSNAVIADTGGLVALYDGEPILALFSSSHGGYGENYSYAFSDPKTKQYPAPALPYLAGGPDIPIDMDLTQESAARDFWTRHVPSYDVKSPYYRWSKRWSNWEIIRTLNKGLLEVSKDNSTKDFVSPLFQPGDSIGTLQRVTVKRRGTSGKAMELEIRGSNGTWTVQKEFLIRKVFSHGGRMLPSGNVVFSHLTDGNGRLVALVAEGGGFGHGVGLSQLGASYMAEHGHAFPAIIQHYYKGVAIGSIPVTVGKTDKGATHRPVKVSFIAKKPAGVLWVETDPNISRPVQLRVNGKPIDVTPTGRRTSVNVGDLAVNEENMLVLFPDPEQPDRAIKAWMELYPPRTEK